MTEGQNVREKTLLKLSVLGHPVTPRRSVTLSIFMRQRF
jgi:hypothetical protein